MLIVIVIAITITRRSFMGSDHSQLMGILDSLVAGEAGKEVEGLLRVIDGKSREVGEREGAL